MTTDRVWVVDTSVVLRAMLGDSPAAKAWQEGRLAEGQVVAGCRMLDLEVRRAILCGELRGDLVPGQVDPEAPKLGTHRHAG